MALSLPEAVESAHMNHPDFRVRGKIFATLGYPEQDWGMIKLTLEQQAQVIRDEPDVFAPVAGGWGRKGATRVHLDLASPEVLHGALLDAWRNVAPKRLVQDYEAE